MTVRNPLATRGLARRLSEAEATIQALLSGQIDAVVDTRSNSVVLLSTAQEALRASEERYRRIVETANEGISVVDANAKLTFVNQRFSHMLGYTATEMLGKWLYDFVPDPFVAALRAEHSRRGLAEELEVQYLRRDGTELWALLKTSPILDGDGRFVGTLGMITDRTLHRQAEEALRKSEVQYRQIVETTTDGIVKLDEGDLITFANPRFAEMLGHSVSELTGAELHSFMSAAAKAQLAGSAAERRRGPTRATDTNYRHKNGTDVWVDSACAPLADEAGRYVGSLCVVRDMTERRKLLSQLMISDRMASVGTLAAGVAHEINNPLAAVIANLDFVDGTMRGKLGGHATPGIERSDAAILADLRAPIDDARDAADRVRVIVRDLKIFSHSATEEPIGSVDVEAILESSVRMAWNEIRHRARLVKQYTLVPRVRGSEARLGQVFLNLIVNAAQSLPEGSAEDNEIRVSTRLDGERVFVEVADTGAGIPPEIIGRVFDAFFTTKPVGVGTGLGLAICQRIVTDLGGELTVESALGKGTTFRAALPVSHEPKTKVATPVEPTLVSGRRGRILVVDDDALVIRCVKRVLSRNHEVIGTLEPREAIVACENGDRFDLILCDVMMPDMTGMDLYREISRIDPGQAKRMVFMTGGAFTEKARLALAETPREKIDKPFDHAALRSLVDRYV